MEKAVCKVSVFRNQHAVQLDREGSWFCFLLQPALLDLGSNPRLLRLSYKGNNHMSKYLLSPFAEDREPCPLRTITMHLHNIHEAREKRLSRGMQLLNEAHRAAQCNQNASQIDNELTLSAVLVTINKDLVALDTMEKEALQKFSELNEELN